MTFSELKRRVSSRLGLRRNVVQGVLDAAIEVMIEAFIDSDDIQLGKLGKMKFKYLPPVKSQSTGKVSSFARVFFEVDPETAESIVQENIKMIGLEEQEGPTRPV